MPSTGSVLPASPAEPRDDVFPLRDRLRLRDNFPFFLQQLRARGTAFGALPKGPWSVFIAVATHFQMNAEAWPGQETLARFTGYSPRAVRYHVTALERGGFLLVRHERRADGSERSFYRPGPVMLRELTALSAAYPRERANVFSPIGPPPNVPVPPAVLNEPPEAFAGAPAETVAMEPREPDPEEPFSCEPSAPTPAWAVPTPEEQVSLAPECREIARSALVERMRRKHPARPPPRWFDARELAMVAACSVDLEGDAEAKLQLHRDAIAGAFLVSKDGPPTVRFIWEKLDHFLDHVERGRQRRLADERAERLRADRKVQSTSVRRAVAAIPPEQMAADLERLFGPGWRRQPIAGDAQ